MNHYFNLICFILNSKFSQCQSQSYFNVSSETLPEEISSYFISTYEDTLWIVAGRGDSNGYLTGSYSARLPFDGMQWNTDPGTLPLGIDAMLISGDNSVTVGDKLYIINPSLGFYSGESATPYHQTFIYDFSSKEYLNGETAPYKAAGICTVYNPYNNIIYAVGGNDGGSVKKYTQRFSVSTNKWLSNGSATVIARYDAGCSLSSNDTLYLFGGDVSNSDSFALEYYLYVEAYDVFMDEWTLINATLNERRSGLQCNLITTDGYIYCVGGETGALDVYTTVDVFDPSTETFIDTELQLNIARTLFGATVWNDGKCLLVAGGVDPVGDTWLDSIETFGDCSGTDSSTSYATTAIIISSANELCNLTFAAQCDYTELTYEQDEFCCSYVLETESAIVSQSELFGSVKLVRDLNIASLSFDWFFVVLVGVIVFGVWYSGGDLQGVKHIIIGITVLGSILDVCLTFSVVGIINANDLIGGVNSLYEEHCYSSTVDQVIFDLSSQFQTIMILDVTEGVVDIVSLLILFIGRFATETIGNVTEGIHAFIFSFFDVLIITVNVAMFVIPSYNTFESTYNNEEYSCFIKTAVSD